MGTDVHVINVNGVPAPKGSARAMMGRGKAAGRALLVASGSRANEKKQAAWKQAIVERINDTNFVGGIPGSSWRKGPITVGLAFRLPDIKAFIAAGGNLKDSAPFVSITKPDVDKLVRSTLDAITAAGCWSDDAQVVFLVALKMFMGHQDPGCTIAFAPGTGGGLENVFRIMAGEVARVTGERGLRKIKKPKNSVTAAKDDAAIVREVRESVGDIHGVKLGRS